MTYKNPMGGNLELQNIPFKKDHTHTPNTSQTSIIKEPYRLLFRNTLDGFAYCQILFENNEPTDFICFEVNRAFEKLTGLHQAAGKKISELIPDLKTKYPELFYKMGAIVNKKEPAKFEAYIEPLKKWFSISSICLEKEFFILHIDDITAKKLVKEKLRESEEKYRLLFENMTSGFQLNEVILDENGDPIDFRFLDGNSLMENYTGYSIEQVRGKTIKEIIPESDSNMIKKYGNVAITGEGFSLEYFSKTFKKYFKIRTYSPKNGLFAVVFNDITERKQTEIKIQEQNEKLQNLNNEKDKFFSIIAHDLRSPFTSIRSMSEMLDEAIENKNFEEARQFSEIVLKLAINANDLLGNLMEWARSQTGRMEYNPEPFELTDLIRVISNFFNLSAEQKSISLTKQLTQSISIYADKAMISTVLRNLISNAIKFTRPGGKINISAEKSLHEIIVLVSDNGVGIHEKALNKIFQISGMYSTKGTQNEMGTGLGLILCKEFIEKHHGKIWVESELGQGSRFYFSLPLNNI